MLAGNPLNIINCDAPTLENYSQANPRTFIFSTSSTSVNPSSDQFQIIRFRQLQRLENSGPPPTEAQRLTIQKHFPLTFKSNSRESSYPIFRSKTSPNTHFQGGGNSEYFIEISYYFLRIRHFIFWRHRILIFVS